MAGSGDGHRLIAVVVTVARLAELIVGNPGQPPDLVPAIAAGQCSGSGSCPTGGEDGDATSPLLGKATRGIIALAQLEGGTGADRRAFA